MSIASSSIQRPVTVVVCVVTVALFGVIGVYRLPVNLLPDISYPTVTVRTELEGAAPEEMEKLVTKPVESAVGVIDGVTRVVSSSRAGVSEVTIEFSWGTRMDFAALDVHEKLDNITLPPEADAPVVLRYDPADEPIARYALTGSASLVQLRRLAEDDIAPGIESLMGVAAVRVEGGLEEEISVAIPENALATRALDISAMGRRVSEDNVDMAGGTIRQGETEYRLRALGQLRDAIDVGNVVVASPDGKPMRLADVARIEHSTRQRRVITRLDGRESVEIAVYKKAENNTVAVADDVEKRVRRLRVSVLGNPGEDAPKQLRALLQKTLASAQALGEPRREQYVTLVRAVQDAAEKLDSRRVPEALVAASRELGARALLLPEKGEDKKFRENALDVVTAVDNLARGASLVRVFDGSRFIREAVGEVLRAAAGGGLLAVLVLLLFLRRLRPTGVVALSIPISVLATFFLMFAAGTSLNVMSLGGLALGIGMLVDNSIVVLESIDRRRAEGEDPRRAAERGTGEVARAIVASTLTTVCVFVPIVFVSGIAGQLFRDQALTVAFSLGASLIVALTVIPACMAPRAPGPDAKHIADDDTAKPTENPAVLLIKSVTRRVLGAVLGRALRPAAMFFHRWAVAPVDRAFSRGLDRVRRGYPPLLERCLDRPWRVVGAGTCMFLLSLVGLLFLGRELIPEMSQGEFLVTLRAPAGTPLLAMERIAVRAEKAALDTRGKHPVGAVATLVGTTLSSGGTRTDRENLAQVQVTLKDGAGADEEDRVVGRLRGDLSSIAGIDPPRFSRPALFSLRTPIEVEVAGTDLGLLREYTTRLAARLGRVDGLVDVRSTTEGSSPELHVLVNRDKLQPKGLTLEGVSSALRDKLQGVVGTKVSVGDRQVDVRLRLREEDRARPDQIGGIVVSPGGDVPVPLAAVARVEEKLGPAEIRHAGNRRTALITAGVAGRDLAAVAAGVRAALKDLPAPPGLTTTMGGQQQEMGEAFESMLGAVLLAVFLVYLVMASLFESLLQPLVVMFSIPLALVGVVAALVVFGENLSVIVLIGCVVLAGIVVNNAIVLVDAVNRFRREGRDVRRALVMGGSVRLRPILMTTATTVLGLLPLVVMPLIPGFGEGAEVRRPMALAIIGGLISSTALTLFFVPSVYLLAARWAGDRAGAKEPRRSHESSRRAAGVSGESRSGQARNGITRDPGAP